MQRFPAMKVLLLYGKWICAAIALSIPGIALWVKLEFQIGGWGLVIVAAFLALVVWFVLTVFVELVKVIAEMLLPT